MATATEQLDSMRHLEPNWDGYGAAAPKAIAIDLAQELTALLSVLIGRSNGILESLYLTPTRVGGVLIGWNDAVAEHEIDIAPDGTLGFLHRDLASGAIETRHFSPGPLQPGLLAQLRRLAAA